MRYILFLIGSLCFAQPFFLGVRYDTTDPMGSCNSRSTLVSNYANGKLWMCDAGTWIQVMGAGGGTITSVALSRTNDTNVTGTVTGSPVTTSGTINFALGWVGTLAVSRGGIGVGTLTGIAKGNGTSAFSAASSTDVVALFSSCSGTQYLGADGACHTASGSGTVTSIATTSPIAGGTITTTGTITCTTCVTGGTLTSGQIVTGNTGQAITVGNLSGDVTTSGGTATSVVKVNGAAVAASATALASNSSSQVIAATYQGNGTKVQLSTGTTTTNNCVKFDANGNTVDAGAACGGSGLSISGWYLTDGMNYYSGPHMAPMTLPVAGNFAWVNQGGASEAANGNALVLTAANGGSSSVRLRKMTIGANTTATAQFALTGAFNNNTLGGIAFRESATGKLVTFNVANAPGLQMRLSVDNWTNATTFGSEPYNNTILGGFFNWVAMRLVYTSGSPGTIDFQISMDDNNWASVYSTNANTFLTTAPDEWGYFVDAEGSTGNSYVTLYSWKTQ